MAKILRATFKQFAVNVNSASDICEFGTPATGSPVYTTNIATLQAATAWTTGWAAETVASNRPFLEDMNCTHYVFAYMLAYIFEMGIPEYDAGTTYFINSVCQNGGICYQSLTDNNIGNTPTVGANWQLLIPITSITGLGSWVSKSFGTIYQAATDGFVTAYDTQANSPTVCSGYTDSSSSPSTVRGFFSGSGGITIGCCMSFPVKKNDYYEVSIASPSGTDAMYFISNGT